MTRKPIRVRSSYVDSYDVGVGDLFILRARQPPYHFVEFCLVTSCGTGTRFKTVIFSKRGPFSQLGKFFEKKMTVFYKDVWTRIDDHQT